MFKLIKGISKTAGLPPGTPIHVGEQKTARTTITVMDYDELHLEEETIERVEKCRTLGERPTVTWINVEGIHQVEILEELGQVFGLHPLTLEDILNTEQRPKLEDFDDYVFFVLKMLSRDSESDEMQIEQTSLVLGPNFVLSFQEGKEGDVFDLVRGRIRNSKGRIRKAGADYLAYALIDATVDNYFIVLEQIGEKIELLGEELIAEPTPETLQAIYDLKREMVFLRKSVWPLREVIGNLERAESHLVQQSTEIYLRDVYDHTIQVIETAETLRDILSGMLDIYLSSISNKMNEVMKVLTIIATIFIPLTFIVGLYGMNFRYMPEIGWRWGYPMVWAVMIVISGAMIFYFRRKRWL